MPHEEKNAQRSCHLSAGGCTRLDAGRIICDVISDLLPLYRVDGSDAPDAATGPRPSKERVVEALTLLEDVMFPGKMSIESVQTRELEFFLDERLSRAFRILSTEIAKALPFRWIGEYARTEGAERSINDIEAEATRITGKFFSRLKNIRQLLIKDVQAAYNGDPAALSFAEVQLAYPGLVAITSHRIAHELYKLDVPVVPRLMSEYTHAKTGIDIHPGARIGESFFIDHGTGVVVGETTEIGANVKLYQGVTLGAKSFPLDEHGHPIKRIKRHPTIEDDVVIYAGATILGGDTRIGARSVIAGNVFLTTSVPPDSFVYMKAKDVEIRANNGK